MSSLNFMLSWVEHEKTLITSGPGDHVLHDLLLILEIAFEFFPLLLLNFFQSHDNLPQISNVVELQFWEIDLDIKGIQISNFPISPRNQFGPAHEILVIIVCLFDLILYVPVNNFSVMLGRVFQGWTSTKQGLMCLAQGHNAVAPARLEPLALWSQVNRSTTWLPEIFVIIANA